MPTAAKANDAASNDTSYPVTGHHIGDEVSIRFFKTQESVPVGEVVGVRFGKEKVTYDISLTLGGATLRNVDSAFVEKVAKKK